MRGAGKGNIMTSTATALYFEVSLDGTRSKILRNCNFCDRPMVFLYEAGSHMYHCSSSVTKTTMLSIDYW